MSTQKPSQVLQATPSAVRLVQEGGEGIRPTGGRRCNCLDSALWLGSTHCPSANGTVRICDNYKLTVNPATQTEEYPLPRIKDLSASLAGGKVVSKVWRSTQRRAFREVKQLLQFSDLLAHFDPEKELILACDATQYRLGAVLLHCMLRGVHQPW